jgi:hypothetical protein
MKRFKAQQSLINHSFTNDGFKELVFSIHMQFFYSTAVFNPCTRPDHGIQHLSLNLLVTGWQWDLKPLL